MKASNWSNSNPQLKETAMALPKRVRLVEVGPRDGLQNEARPVPVEVKVELINRLTDAGHVTVEAGSFVSPKWVPQMASTDEVMAKIRRKPGVSYPVLVPNKQGFNAALEAKVEEIAVFAAASESFSRKNINCSIAESLERFAPVVEAARHHNIKVRGYVSTVVGCPYEGDIAPQAVAEVAAKLLAMGCYEISLGETIGVATPGKCVAMVEAVAAVVPREKIAVHFHDTYGQALANILACMERGITVMDSAVAGLGGCPYAKGASGNVGTEDVLYMLNGLGIEHGVDIEKIAETGRVITAALGRQPASKVAQAMAAKLAA
jgi:hydroxymethylglutaryl-CoA lyase